MSNIDQSYKPVFVDMDDLHGMQNRIHLLCRASKQSTPQRREAEAAYSTTSTNTNAYKEVIKQNDGFPSETD